MQNKTFPHFIQQAYQAKVLLRKVQIHSVGTRYPFKDQVVLTTQNIERNATNALDINDLPYIRLHDIRHLIGTYSINVLNLPIEKVSHTLGHTNIETTQKYVTIKPETSKQVIDKIINSVILPDKVSESSI